MAKKILIVDDERNIAISVEFLMRREGYEVSVAGDGEEALAMMRADPPDLVVLDVMMPKRNGYEVCEAIRGDAVLCRTRVVMLTAKGREAEVKKGLGLGADAYVVKPFSTSDLVAQVKELLAV